MAVYLKETLAYMRLRELNLPPYRQKSPQVCSWFPLSFENNEFLYLKSTKKIGDVQ